MGTGVRQSRQSATACILAVCVLACLEGPASGALLPVDRRAPHASSGAAAAASLASFPPASRIDGKPHSAFGGRVSAVAPPAFSRSLAPPAAAGPPRRADALAEDDGSSSSAAAVGGAFEAAAPSLSPGGYGGDLADRSAHEARGTSAGSSVAEEGARISSQQQQQQQQSQQYRQHHQQQQQPPPSLGDGYGGYGGRPSEPDAAGSEEFRWSGSPPITSQTAEGGAEAGHADYY